MKKTKQGTQGKRAVPKFPCLLYEMLEDAEKNGFDDIVSWHSNGKSFKIHKPDLFVETIMPRYFKHQTRYKSFRRQLNLYCFGVEKTGVNKGYFRHESFLRGDQLLCSSILRPTTTTSSRKSKKTTNIENRGNIYHSSEQEDDEEKSETDFSTTTAMLLPPDDEQQELDYFTDDHQDSSNEEDTGTDTIISIKNIQQDEEDKNDFLMTPLLATKKRLKEHQEQKRHQNLDCQLSPKTTKPVSINSIINAQLPLFEEARSMVATKEEKHHEQYFTSTYYFPEQEGSRPPRTPTNPEAMNASSSIVDSRFKANDDTKNYYSRKVNKGREEITELCNLTAFIFANAQQQTQNPTTTSSQGRPYGEDVNGDWTSRQMHRLPIPNQTSFVKSIEKQATRRKEFSSEQGLDKNKEEAGVKICLVTASGSDTVTIDSRTIIHDEDIVDEIISTFVRPGVVPPIIHFI